MRKDEIKLLCYMILISFQTLTVIAFALLYFPNRWISHKLPEKDKQLVKDKFGSAVQQDENLPIVESVSSHSLSDNNSQ